MDRRHSLAALLCFLRLTFIMGCFQCTTASALANVGMALLAVLFVLALLSRVWNLMNFPDNIYPDEIMTGTVATQSYLSPTTPPSVFITLWSGIDLPALWFWFVAVFLKLGGTSLAMLRLPAALFGAATVISLYALLRGTWGRYAAIAGSAIMAFSVSNVHLQPLGA